MQFQQSDLVQLKEALLSGALSISSNGRTVNFQSITELKKLINEIETSIAAYEATEDAPFKPVSNRITATFSK